MPSNQEVYDHLKSYIATKNDEEKKRILEKLDKFKTKGNHKLLEHDEYFYYTNRSPSEKNDRELDGFELSNNQKFLKQFMSLSTKNDALLLFHGVGVGKTCSSIQIAQNFNMKRSGMQKTIVITSTLLISNYKKELFDVSKVKDIHNTCLGDEYVKNIPNYEKLSKKDLQKQVQSLIKNDFDFFGYLEFTNEVERNSGNKSYQEYLRENFSNRLIIVDEVHNIRSSSGKDFKKIPIILGQIYRNAFNVRILFLSATPMYNEAEECLLLMNIMRDYKKPLLTKDIFNETETEIKPAFKTKLEEFAQDHVSFMRGENPHTFPIRLNPSINKDPKVLLPKEFPKLDVYNNPIDEFEFGAVELVASYFQEDHQSAYKTMPYKSGDDSEEKIESDGGTDVQKRIQLANMYYPTAPLEVGRKGLKAFFQISDDTKGPKYSLKKGKEDLFTKENISKYSPKISTIVDYINKSEGIVIVYSRYIDSGIVPLALALESQGYNRYEENNLWKSKQKGKGNYIILSGDSVNKDKYINFSKRDTNKDGDQIKVILMSQVATEGVDFKNVREIHVLEPWHNMSLIEQVNGRGVRNFSHIQLPEEKRNVTLYLHVNMLRDDTMESVDFRMYRRSMMKQKKISMVERVLKYASIDCNLNKSVNYYKKGFMKRNIITSQGVKINDYELGDMPNTKICDYTKCEYDCKPVITKEPKTVKDPLLIEYDIHMYLKKIIKLFEKAAVFFLTYSDIEKHFENKYILEHALIKMTDGSIHTLNKEKGKFLYRSNKYIFVSNRLDDEKMALRTTLDKVSVTQKILMKDAYKLSRNQNKKAPENMKARSEFLEKVDEIVKAIESSVEEVDRSVVMGMVFDKLSSEEQLGFIRSIISETETNKNKNEFTMLEDSGLIRVSDDREIVSYLDVYTDQLYVKNKSKKPTFEKASPIQKTEDDEKFEAKHTDQFKKDNFVLGFVEISKKKNKGIFKMANKDSLKNNKRNSIIGTACEQTSQLNNKIMIKYITEIGIAVKGSPKKQQLCWIYEYGLRVYRGKEGKVFFRPRLFHSFKGLKKDKN